MEKVQAQFDSLKLGGHKHITMKEFLRGMGIKMPIDDKADDEHTEHVDYPLPPYLLGFRNDIVRIAFENLTAKGGIVRG